MGNSLDDIDLDAAPPELVEILETEYEDRLHRTDSLCDQLEGKAQRIASVVLPFGGVAFGVVATQGDKLTDESQLSFLCGAYMLIASGILAGLSMWFRRYTGTTGFVPTTAENYASLNKWLTAGATDVPAAVKSYRIMRIRAMTTAIQWNNRQNAWKTRYCKWSLWTALGTLPAATVVFFAMSFFCGQSQPA